MNNINVNHGNGLNGLSCESKAEFLGLIWNDTANIMCLAKMIFDDHGAPSDYIIMDINPALVSAFGLERDQAVNKRITELFPDGASKWIELFGETVRKGKSLVSVEQVLEPYPLYEVQVFPLGSKDQFMIMAQDVTRQNAEKVRIENDLNSNKMANQALTERLELFNALMDNNPSLVFLKDGCGRYVYVNKTYEQQFTGPKNWYGKTDFDFWSKESAELFRANDQAVLESGQVTQYLEDSIDMDGTRYCWLNYKFPYTDAKKRRYTGGIGIDVTKRILAEEALRKAEEKLQRYAEELKTREEEALELIDSFTEGSWIVDRLAGTFTCSEKWSKRIGLSCVPEKERLSYTHTLTYTDDTVHGNSIEYCMEKGLTRFDLEYRVKTVDCGYIWTQNRGKIIYDTKGTAIKVYAATIDITERKRAEEALAVSEAKYRAIVENAGEGIVISRTDGTTAFVNQRMADMLGYKVDEMLGKAGSIFAFPDQESRIHEANVEVHKSSALEGDFKFRRKDGTPLWTHYTAVRMIDERGEHVSSMGLHTDITERKWAEEALAAERKRFLNVLETLPIMICLITPDYHIPFSNKAFNEKFGEANGRHCYDCCCGFSEPCTFCESLLPLKTGQANHWEFTALDGSTIIEAYDFPFSDIDGSPMILKMGIDITERKRAEAALQESENRAHELVRVLEEADKSKNKFISVLSHELRNPLAAINVGLSVLEVSTDIHHTESVKDVIKRQVDQLCRLVDDLLDLTRITQNKIRLKKENILLNEIVREAVEDIKPEFDKKGVKLQEEILAKPVYIYADPVRIAQCVGNLLHNAVKFTPPCGNVRVSLKQENNEAVICVQDNGIGISQAILAKLFMPFTQADESLDRYDNNGLGLGLSIVKGIVELHGGTVTAASEGLGKGTMFTINLPISEVNTGKQGNAAIQNAGRSLKILVIEDNKDLADLLLPMFSMFGHEAYAVHNGIDGIVKAREIQPDIIFCDIGLPGKNGFEVAKIIKQDASLKNVFLVALSGYAGEPDIEMARKSGFNRHLAKPINMDILKRMLSEDLDRQKNPSIETVQ